MWKSNQPHRERVLNSKFSFRLRITTNTCVANSLSYGFVNSAPIFFQLISSGSQWGMSLLLPVSTVTAMSQCSPEVPILFYLLCIVYIIASVLSLRKCRNRKKELKIFKTRSINENTRLKLLWELSFHVILFLGNQTRGFVRFIVIIDIRLFVFCLINMDKIFVWIIKRSDVLNITLNLLMSLVEFLGASL